MQNLERYAIVFFYKIEILMIELSGHIIRSKMKYMINEYDSIKSHNI